MNGWGGGGGQVGTGNMRIVRLWRAAMGTETHLFKDISKGRMRTNAGTLPRSWFGKIFYQLSCSMEINNNIKVCRRDSYSGFKKVSQMTFRSFPKLKFLNLKTLKFVQNIQPSTYVANWPLTNEHSFRKGNKQTWHQWQFHSDFTLNIWAHEDFSISFGT